MSSEQRYLRDLLTLAKRFLAAKTPAALRRLADEPSFQRVAHVIARRMVYSGRIADAQTWRAAAREAGRGALFHRLLKKELAQTRVGAISERLVRENAELISSLPLTLAERTTAYIAQRQQKGIRSEEINKELKRWFPQLATSRIKLIARTETAKAAAALTEARSEDLDIPAYQWLTVEDERVRRSHRFMDKVICFWNDPPAPERLIGEPNPPAPYSAGSIYNCRCTAAPLISLDEVTWPARVAANGTVSRMTLGAFKRLLATRQMAA